MSQPTIVARDRIVLRDRLWIVRHVTSVEGGYQLLTLEALDGDEPATLDVAVPPEEFQPLPTEVLTFAVDQIDSFAAWAPARRILAATLWCRTPGWSQAPGSVGCCSRRISLPLPCFC